jgi:cation diffusion facilitator CzcD-associated flavoprotein CzcO
MSSRNREFSDRIDRVRVIGAGSSGLVAARCLIQVGLKVDVPEACDDLGGNWNYALPVARVYRSTHTISSKPGTQFPYYPMPDS